MDILGVQINKDDFSEVYAKINPLKKEIKINTNLKNPKVIISIPVKDSTFRVFKFDFDDESKIRKAVETSIKIEFPNPENIVWAYYKDKSHIYCVITRKNLIDDIKNKYKNIHSIDSDIFSILRLLKHNGYEICRLIHFYEDYAVYLEVKNSLPESIRTISSEEAIEILNKDKSILISGFLPKNLENPVLNNPLNRPDLNIAFGNAIKPIYRTGVDFLHKETFFSSKNLIIFTISFILLFLFINIGLFVKNYTVQKELKNIKNKEKIVYMKYFGGIAIDPLRQAKGKIATLKEKSKITEDVSDILDFIGEIRKNIKNIDIVFLNVSYGKTIIKGYADSIQIVDKFRTTLKMKFKEVKIDESVKDANGKIRFRITAKL